MRIVLIGSVKFSKSALVRLLETKADVVGIYTLQKSSFNAYHVDLAPLGEALGISFFHANDINSADVLSWIENKKPDVIFCFGWSRLLKENLLSIPPLGVVGFHPAAPPANRGRHPIIWALALGLKKTASTFYFIGTDADSDDILSQEEIASSDSDDAGSLYQKITDTALEQIEAYIPQLASSYYSRKKQNSKLVTSWRKRRRSDGEIDWRTSARAIHNLVRASAKPYVGAHFIPE